MNTIKRHRVVLREPAFQRVAHMLNDRAVECAENEGWPIPADAREPARAMAHAGVVRRVAVLLGTHMKHEIRFWSGRTAVPLKRTLLPRALRLHARMQGAAP